MWFVTCRVTLVQFRDFTKLSCAVGPWFRKPFLWRQSSWWRHQMETFSALLAICAGNSPVPGEFPTQRPVTRSFDVYFDLRPNKRLSKQSWGWWLRCHRAHYDVIVMVGVSLELRPFHAWARAALDVRQCWRPSMVLAIICHRNVVWRLEACKQLLRWTCE